MRALCQAVMIGLALMISGCNPEDYASPTQVFRETFGVDPGPTILDLRAEGRGFRDSSNCYLEFRVPRPQLDGLLRAAFTELTADQFATKTAGARLFGPRPSWWTPLAGTPTVFLESANFHPLHTRGQAFVSYDPTSQIAYMYWDGID